MANVERFHGGYQLLGQYLQQAAASRGITPSELLMTDYSDFEFLLSVDAPYDGYVVGHFLGGMDWEVAYQPDTLAVTNIRVLFNGSLFYEWQGSMTPEQFFAVEWPVTTSYGSNGDDFFFIGDGGIGYGGYGNDILELEGNAIAYGGSGVDGYDLSGFCDGCQMRIADYEVGEKILFSMYDSFDELVSAFKGVTNEADGFTLHFGQPYSAQWSLTIEGTPLEAMRLEDLLVGVAGSKQLYAPLLEASGIV